ncbi:putative bifunctional diguanylate cyclase/phosphodiesterase [Krasilnikovia sp. MM14-A1259]|uniref:putative bifunctional diguanylate cyclase/phosphodiesterase n=1 Tax=Krasilnikovia sp. MM14-A1259 TaxID=3373539 RepID=UPI0037F92C29
MGASEVLHAPGAGGQVMRIGAMSRLLRLSGLLMLLSSVWFVINVVHPVGPAVLLWLSTPVAALLATAVCWRTATTATLPEPTRRFWRSVTVAALLTGVAQSAQAIYVLTRTGDGGSHTGPVMLAAGAGAVLVVGHALYRLPLGKHSVGALLRIVLDAATVILAAAVFLWHFVTREQLGSDHDSMLMASLALIVLALVAVFTVVKVLLTGCAFVDVQGLRLVAIALFIGAVAPVLQPVLLAHDPRLLPTELSIPVVFFLAAWAAERQRHADFGPRRGVATMQRRRVYSVLPYAAVAAVDGLLLYVFRSDDRADAAVVVGAAVALTTLVVLRQVTAFRDNARLLRQLDHGANHDALTGLPNRILFHKRLNKALTAPGERNVSVALIDLDDFKVVNDSLGHEVGDLLLIAVAQRLAGCIRAEDTVARLGGDEFVVVLDGADPAAADLAADRMVAALRAPVVADGHELPIRASIGIADGSSGDEASLLLRHADIAMYAAKNVSGTAYLHYHPNMATGSDHANVGAELREAIDREELFLLYQPIVSLDDGRLMGAEALVRWAHPTRGTLGPDAFIPVAERTGLVVPLGRWVMKTAFQQFADWIGEHGDAAPHMMNINVSARDLREPGFADFVGGLLKMHKLPAHRITLEITETMALEPGQSITNLHDLRELGLRVSLDDFGTGHSTLTMLHDCPIDEIKLDRSFTQANIDGRVPMAAAVIHLAQVLGLHAVAEGVETSEQAELLLSLGYIAAQGYHFSRPMSPEQFAKLLAPRTIKAVPQAWQMSA